MNNRKLSIFYHHMAEAAKQTNSTVEEIMRIAKGAGIEYTELDYWELAESDEIPNRLKKAGLKISCIYGSFPFGKTATAEDGLKFVRRAAELGSEKIMIIPGFWDEVPDRAAGSLEAGLTDEMRAEREKMLDIMQQMSTLAVELGMIPTIEDYDDAHSPIATAEGMLWFLDRIPELRVAFDTGNFLYSEENVLDAFEPMKDKIVHMHCKDRSLIARSGMEEKLTVEGRALYPSIVGEGCIPMKHIIEMLEARGYDGNYAIEHFGTSDQLGYMLRSAMNLRTNFDGVVNVELGESVASGKSGSGVCTGNGNNQKKIRVTVWNEYFHEREYEGIAKVYPKGIHGCIADFLGKENDIEVRCATLDMPNQGITKELLDNTDVLIWWGHAKHDEVTDENAELVCSAVRRGMGLIALHSAHMAKIMKNLLGTSMTLSWKHGDKENLWCTCPTHPIAQGVPACIALPQEEMYGEFFDIPKPDDVVFTGWFGGGEVFRSGCTFTRGLGKIFYFQPGHEEYPIYYDKDIQKIIVNAVRWAKAENRSESELECRALQAGEGVVR